MSPYEKRNLMTTIVAGLCAVRDDMPFMSHDQLYIVKMAEEIVEKINQCSPDPVEAQSNLDRE